MSKQKDFNNIKQWLLPLLKERQLSVEKFANKVGVTRAFIYFILSDINRPSEETMARMCSVLGVPYEEGLRQYTPRADKGYRAGYLREVTVRGAHR